MSGINTKRKRAIRNQLMLKQNSQCARCKVVMNEDDIVSTFVRSDLITTTPGDTFPTIDHIRPLGLGGTNTITNLRLLCTKCNQLLGEQLGKHLTFNKRQSRKNVSAYKAPKSYMNKLS